jgi:geranylgeranyl diphosphate synthase type I
MAMSYLTDHPATDENFLTHVEDILASYLAERGAQVSELDPMLTPVVQALKDFVQGGGKRIRPTFVWWGWRGAGGQLTDLVGVRAALRVGAAVELIQACALIHDDLIDSSLLRRGTPTIHRRFASFHTSAGWAGNPESFGCAAAILLGDVALAWADDLVMDVISDHPELIRIRPAWQAMRTEVLAGQFLDVRAQASDDEQVASAQRVNELKTAAYTVQRPLHLGALVADAPADLIARYLEFGKDLGVAFQLRDDELGVFGDPLVTGKPAGDDLREGKRTALIALGISKSNPAQAKSLAQALGNDHLTQADVAQARRTLIEVGALAELETTIEALRAEALAILAKAALPTPAAQALQSLAQSITNRSH